ncbi:hypothetical protein Tco_1052550, partial [Tanacetum coccineum]
MSSETKLTRDEDEESVDDTKYHGMIGSLLYLMARWPDIMFSVCLCARFQEDLKTSHLKWVKRIFRYIKGTTHLGLWYPKGTGMETIVYADSDHVGDYVDRKITSGVCTFMGCCLTSWFSKKKTALAISTTEAEYVSTGKACQQALWMKQALVDYDIVLDDIPSFVTIKLSKHISTSGVDASTGGKYVAALQGLLEHSTLPVEVGVTAVPTSPFITSSYPTERFVVLSDSPCHSSSNAADAEVSSVVRPHIPDPPIMTTAIATTVVAAASYFLVPRAGDEPVHASIFADSTSAGTVGPDIASPSQPASTELSTDTFYVSQDMDSEMLRQIYVPKWNMVIESALNDPDVCRSLVDQLAPLVLFSQLRGMDYDQLFAEFKLGLHARHVLALRDVEIASLRAQLTLKEDEAAEVIRLRGQVSVAEAIEATRVAELNGLKKRTATLEGQLSCDELSVKAASFESEKDKLTDQVSMLETTCSGLRDQVSGYELFKEQTEAVQDEQVKILSDKVAELVMGMDLHLDEEFYPHFLTIIYLAALGGAIDRAIDKGMQYGMAVDIDHEKARRGLVDVATYNPSAEANYIFAVNALRAMNFPTLAQLESQKDASMADIMGLLHLEGPSGYWRDFFIFSLDIIHARVQRIRGDAASHRLPLSDAMVPLIESLSAENLIGEASTSGVSATATTTALSTTFIQTSSVPPISVADYEVSGAGPSTKVPSPLKIVFEKEELETTPEH